LHTKFIICQCGKDSLHNYIVNITVRTTIYNKMQYESRKVHTIMWNKLTTKPNIKQNYKIAMFTVFQMDALWS